MKRLIIMLVSLILLSCIDNERPAPPRGLYTITGDEMVTITWLPNQESDLVGYNVYRSYSPEGPYSFIGSTPVEIYIDTDVENGVTYFYTVTAFDEYGNESPPSPEVVYDTPRPEGSDLVLFDAQVHPDYSGYDFSSSAIVGCDYPLRDIVFGSENGIPYLYAGPDALIQDFGYISSLDVIDYAPLDGWSSTGRVEAIEGHGYIIWTWDNHFAKIRIDALNNGWLSLSWAYQIDEGNRELSLNQNFKLTGR